MKSASLTANLLVSKGSASPSLPREVLDPANYADQAPIRRPQVAKAPNVGARPLVRPIVKTAELPKVAPRKPEELGERISTTVRLPPMAHKRLRLLAARDRVNLQWLLEQATADLLNRELGEDDCVCSGDNK